jgi:hypothetical protein
MLATDLLALLQNAQPTLGEALGFPDSETLKIGFLAQGYLEAHAYASESVATRAPLRASRSITAVR